MISKIAEPKPGRRRGNRAAFVHALTLSAPIILGYLPIGTAYGVLGAQAGLPVWIVLGMSVCVYAGSAQFIAVQMMQLGSPWTVLTLTTFFVNLRHVLLSLALVPYFRKVGRGRILAAGFGLTDESFAVNSVQFSAGNHSVNSALLVNFISYIAWIAASALGYFLSSLIPDPSQYGLDFALPAMFIGLLFLQLKRRVHYVVLTVAGVLTISLHKIGLEQWSVIVAAVIGACVGAVVSTLRDRSRTRR